MPDNEGKNTNTHTYKIFKNTPCFFHGNAPSYYAVPTNTLHVLFCLYISFFCLSASVYVIQCISPHQQAGHTCAPQSEKNSTVATTGSDTNTVNQMQPEFFIFPYIVGARKENRVVACVVGVANFVVCGKGTKL